MCHNKHFRLVSQSHCIPPNLSKNAVSQSAQLMFTVLIFNLGFFLFWQKYAKIPMFVLLAFYTS